jgi:hypothetical protein
MRLGTQTGSLTNHILSRATRGQPEPTVGMGATILSWTDRHGATIIEVGSYRGRMLLTVREDKATRTDTNGMSECQSYRFDPDEKGTTYRFLLDKKGMWRQVVLNMETGNFVYTDGSGLRIGDRSTYHNYNNC